MGVVQSYLRKPEEASVTCAGKFRPATKDDLDDITLVHEAGFVVEPEALYRYPLRNEFPEDYFKWTKKEYECMLDQPNKYVVHVIDGDVDDVQRPVALAVWDVDIGIQPEFSDPGIDERRDANKDHCIEFRNETGKRFTTFFSRWGKEIVHLSVLVVHPDFRRRGLGTTLVNWGIERANAQQWPVTLAASPIGRLLYEHLGFKAIGMEVVQIEGEEERCESTIMIREYKAEAVTTE